MHYLKRLLRGWCDVMVMVVVVMAMVVMIRGWMGERVERVLAIECEIGAIMECDGGNVI